MADTNTDGEMPPSSSGGQRRRRARGGRGRSGGNRSRGGAVARASGDVAIDDIEQLATTEALQDFCDTAAAEGAVGLDTEFHWERTYAPALCLVQLATADRVAVADPIENPDLDLSPIAALIADPSVEVRMHAPHADLVAFVVHYSITPSRIFDTQLAAGFAGLGANLPYERLVRELAGVDLSASEGFTDWRKRPLTDMQMVYAANDVAHLETICAQLTQRLHDKGRTRWLHDELAPRFEDPTRLVTLPEDAWRKVSRRGRLGAKELGALRELAAWRERRARDRDMPVGWVLKDATLVEIAKRKPSDGREVKAIRGIEGSLRDRDLDALARCVEAGIEHPIHGAPDPHAGHHPERRQAAVAKALAGALVRARCGEHGIAPELVATSAELDAAIDYALAGDTAADGDGGPALLRGWRRDLVGSELLDLLAGTITLRLAKRDPFLAVERRDA